METVPAWQRNLKALPVVASGCQWRMETLREHSHSAVWKLQHTANDHSDDDWPTIAFTIPLGLVIAAQLFSSYSNDAVTTTATSNTTCAASCLKSFLPRHFELVAMRVQPEAML